MKKLLAISLVTLLVLGSSAVVLAQGANPNVQFAMDCQVKYDKRACETQTYASCTEINQEYHEIGYTHVIQVVYMYYALRAVEYGLDWRDCGAYFTSHTNCADFIVGGENLGGYMSCAQTWSLPQYAADPDPGTSGIAVGWLQIYTYYPCRVDYIPSDQNNILAVDQNYVIDEYHTVHSGFLGSEIPPDPPGEPVWSSGDLPPCVMGPTATEESTWGSLKALYH